MATFLQHICNNERMADKRVFSDCCNINKTARHKCFLLHKKDDAGYSEIFQISNPEQICEMGKESQVLVKRQVSHLSLPRLWKRVFSNFEERFLDKTSEYTMLYYIKIK